MLLSVVRFCCSIATQAKNKDGERRSLLTPIYSTRLHLSHSNFSSTTRQPSSSCLVHCPHIDEVLMEFCVWRVDVAFAEEKCCLSLLFNCRTSEEQRRRAEATSQPDSVHKISPLIQQLQTNLLCFIFAMSNRFGTNTTE